MFLIVEARVSSCCKDEDESEELKSVSVGFNSDVGCYAHDRIPSRWTMRIVYFYRS